MFGSSPVVLLETLLWNKFYLRKSPQRIHYCIQFPLLSVFFPSPAAAWELKGRDDGICWKEWEETAHIFSGMCESVSRCRRRGGGEFLHPQQVVYTVHVQHHFWTGFYKHIVFTSQVCSMRTSVPLLWPLNLLGAYKDCGGQMYVYLILQKCSMQILWTHISHYKKSLYHALISSNWGIFRAGKHLMSSSSLHLCVLRWQTSCALSNTG